LRKFWGLAAILPISLETRLFPLGVRTTDPVTLIQQLASQFSTAARQLLQVINLTVIDLSRAAYITVILLGVLLYSTRLERRLGKDMIKGGIVLALLAEFIFPMIAKV
jgi:hypothetical protein